MNVKTQIGCSGATLSKRYSLGETLKVLKRADFDSVDFWLYLYSLESDNPMWQDDWHNWVMEVKRKIEEAGLEVCQIHGILNTYIPEDFRFEPPTEVCYRNIEACRMLNCDRIVYHPAFYVHRVSDEATRRKVLEYNIQWFGMLLDTAKKYQVKIQLENTFDFKKVQQPGDPSWPLTTAADMLALFDGLGDSKWVELCLDTGHANIAGQDIPAMIRAYGPRLGTVHLNDNYGSIEPVYEDLHLFPGYGRIDWRSVFLALREVRFDGTLNLEPVGELTTVSEEVRDIQMKAAVEVLRAMAVQSGFTV